MKKELAFAYAEVLEVLKYIPMEKYNLITDNILNALKQNCDEKCNFKYNIALPFENQGLSEKTKEILRFFDENFWKKDDEQKIKEKYPLKLKELFPKDSINSMQECTELVEVQRKNWINRAFIKIRAFFFK